jgi:TM2 domain-containing membrane protein YozV
MSKSKGAALLLSGFAGIIGADKFYIGEPVLGLIQMFLSISIFGLLVSIPWTIVSTVTLLVSIMVGGATTFLYPNVDWEPVGDADIAIALFILFSYLTAAVTPSISKNITLKNELE